MDEERQITIDDIYMVLDRIETNIMTGFVGLHDDLEKIQRLIRENTDAVHLASER
jgi:hypothetical protein